ncbi:MAG: NADPH-dependent FMN reductase [Flavobacteriales bacterium]
MKPQVAIISVSIREGRRSHRVALYFKNYLAEHLLADTEIIDLRSYNFPLFTDTLKAQKDPSTFALEFGVQVNTAEAIIIVTPEYNGGMPASLKNAIDLLNDEWRNKPIGICTVSAGALGGSQVLMSLQFSLWKIGATIIASTYSVAKVQEAFSETGVPTDAIAADAYAKIFLTDLLDSIQSHHHAIAE